MRKQVDKSHYQFSRYTHKRRWASLWHQLDEVLKFDPQRVLEIGPGAGIFKAACSRLGVEVETVDIDPELDPDHVCSVLDLPFGEGTFDVACAFQMLEHIPFEDSLRAFREIVRVASSGVVISLPDAKVVWPVSVHLPRLGRRNYLIPKPTYGMREHSFDGEHWWEINKRGFELSKIVATLSGIQGASLQRSFRVPENPYHRFFVFKIEGENKLG